MNFVRDLGNGMLLWKGDGWCRSVGGLGWVERTRSLGVVVGVRQKGANRVGGYANGRERSVGGSGARGVVTQANLTCACMYVLARLGLGCWLVAGRL